MAVKGAADGKKPVLGWLPLCHESCQTHIIRALWLLLALFSVREFYFFGPEVTHWDLLLLTGILTFILGLRMVADLPRRFELTVQRLVTRGVLGLRGDEREQFFDGIERHAQDWARIGGVLAALAMAGAFAVALIQGFYWSRALLGVGEVLGAYIAGTYLGRMASYGQLGWQVQRPSIEIVVQPTHVDGVAGLKPVGDYYFRQAMIAGLPAVFLAAWWFLFPIWPRDYTHWEEPYLALLSVAIVVEILAFLIPIWSFHRIMLREKAKWLARADQLCMEISELERIPESGEAWKTKSVRPDQIEEMRNDYWCIENMATWPVDVRTRKRFRLSNVLLVIPLLGDVAKRSLDWKQVLDVFRELAG